VVGYNIFPGVNFGSGRSLEFVATYAVASTMPLRAQMFQTIGFASGSLPFNDLPLLAIGTFDQNNASAGNVNALTWTRGTATSFPSTKWTGCRIATASIGARTRCPTRGRRPDHDPIAHGGRHPDGAGHQQLPDGQSAGRRLDPHDAHLQPCAYESAPRAARRRPTGRR
jgi:hypothetical protein